MERGRIIKALSGFYYVKSGDKIYRCQGRGVFRNQKISPLVGDFVEFERRDYEEGYIMRIEPPSTELIRPPIANIDQAIIISSARSPEFSPILLDRFLVLVEYKQIQPVIFITKADLLSDKEKETILHYQKVYKNIGYPVELLSVKDKDGLPDLGHYFKGKVTVFAGQSGVGKSSLLNALVPSLTLATNEVSESLGRGKHTTRHVELIEAFDGLIADTPGFSSLELTEIDPDELTDCFPEMANRKEQCKFRGCLHDKEPACAVKQAVDNEQIASFRYENYLRFLNEIQNRKPRY